MEALVTHDLPSITRVDVAVASQRLRVVCGRTYFDILIGDIAKTWSVVQLLADVPMLSDCGVFVDDAFSNALRGIVPEFVPPPAVQLGKMQDLVAREQSMYDMQRRCALAATGANGSANVVRFCTTARLHPNGIFSVLVLTEEKLFVLDMHHDRGLFYPHVDIFEVSCTHELTDFEKILFDPSTPTRAQLQCWRDTSDINPAKQVVLDFTFDSVGTLYSFVSELNTVWQPWFGVEMQLESPHTGGKAAH
eukprot:m.1387316 g.1387316  ORF g.1387316 m.1387316 type:complete len:249 (-) comp24982_c0_seq4:2024-2770(-)